MDQRIIDIPNYSCTRQDRIWSDDNVTIKKGGGVCCFIRSDIDFSDTEFSEYNVSNKNIEAQWILINQPHLKKIIFCNLYRPPQGNATEFCNTLNNTILEIKSLFEYETDLIIMGDFNINYFNQTSPGYNDIKWLEQRTGLKQYINDPTRYSQTNSCIHLFFSDCMTINESGVLDINISDHQAIFLTRKHVTKPKQHTEFTGRSYLDFDEELFCERLIDYDWDHLYDIECVNEAWFFSLDYVYIVIDDMCPLKSFKIKNLKDPWITNEILESIHDKDILMRRAKRSDNVNDWIEARIARNKTNIEIKNIKADFIQENLEHQNDSKKFWTDVQIILPKKIRVILVNTS